MGEQVSERESLARAIADGIRRHRDPDRIGHDPAPVDYEATDAALAWFAAHQPARVVPCPECGGDGATYVQARVGQAATPLVCSACGGDGTVAARMAPSAEDLEEFAVEVFEASHEPSFSDDAAGMAEARARAQHWTETYFASQPTALAWFAEHRGPRVAPSAEEVARVAARAAREHRVRYGDDPDSPSVWESVATAVLAAHQPARVVPSAEEDPEPEFVQYAPEEAVGNDDDLVQWAFDKGVTWGEWHERHLTRLHDAARIARTETKGGE